MKKTDYNDPKDLEGKQVEIIADTTSHLIPIGEIVTITKGQKANPDYFYNSANSFSIRASEFKLVDLTIEGFNESIIKSKERIELIKKEIEVSESKKLFMIKNKLKVFNEDTFKVFNVLSTLKSKKSDIEMAQAIAKLIK